MRVVGEVGSSKPFSFTLEPHAEGGFVLGVDFAGGFDARVGRWATPEEAQAVARKITGALFADAHLAWHASEAGQQVAAHWPGAGKSVSRPGS